jgi:hypothetical protein
MTMARMVGVIPLVESSLDPFWPPGTTPVQSVFFDERAEFWHVLAH